MWSWWSEAAHEILLFAHGAEHLLTRRAVSREVGEKVVGLMR
jgi:hypothetical protein